MNRIYIAGPYSGESVTKVLANMRQGMRKATELILKGYAPFCPWVDYHYSLMLKDDEVITKEQYLAYSMAFLEVCDAVLLLPGWELSEGTKAEIAVAEKIGIAVFKPEEEKALYDFLAIPGMKIPLEQYLDKNNISDAEIVK